VKNGIEISKLLEWLSPFAIGGLVVMSFGPLFMLAIIALMVLVWVTTRVCDRCGRAFWLPGRWLKYRRINKQSKVAGYCGSCIAWTEREAERRYAAEVEAGTHD
jgi:hypothetical protein